MKKLGRRIFYEGKGYLEADAIGKREIEKVFQGVMMLEKEIAEHEAAEIHIQVFGTVRIHGVPEALEKKMLDCLDDELWFLLRDG